MSASSIAVDAAMRLYASDQASQTLGMTLEQVGPGHARVAMTVRPDMLNGHGNCHGGLIVALADSAFAFACNTYGHPTVAAGATIDFLAPARVGEVLTAEATEVWRGGRIGLYDVRVTQGNTVVAVFRGRSHQLNRSLPMSVD